MGVVDGLCGDSAARYSSITCPLWSWMVYGSLSDSGTFRMVPCLGCLESLSWFVMIYTSSPSEKGGGVVAGLFAELSVENPNPCSSNLRLKMGPDGWEWSSL